ncbi:c-type cytochrome biogenesis protein CcsB [Ruicaihuangia caeni]|uniref:C-type cytochrome biogenesis protein CcsB n=1 Tax=Ruicaihuangia caeni TaxID=3042517 RepID=A0AAW6T839_9MICO|nr:c-type cytochrome biogenesis protein CcsB [Klugiella sp. YN-L-19]MDI2098906.1 c-type cytochrome biogenesis protein CcsB [Klugiella sp. YN-L-19]
MNVNAELDTISLVLVYSAMAVYTLAFISYALDLARRSADKPAKIDGLVATDAGGAPAARSSSVGAAIGTASTATVARTTAAERRGEGAGRAVREGREKGSPSLKVGFSLTVLGFLIHLAADVLRGIAAGRVPWANMYEFSLTMTLIIVGVFIAVQVKQDLRFLGTFVIGLSVLILGVSTVGFYVSVIPLPPALQSPWLVIHVFVASLATGFLALGFALSIVQLLQYRRELLSLELQAVKLRFLRSLPSAERLENLAYRLNIVGFIFWTFTLIAGAVWAERAWGRYWGWDTKEVWTFIVWVLYAGYIHARATRGWRGNRSAWLAIIGFSAILFNYTVVNLFFKGLHAYSGL